MAKEEALVVEGIILRRWPIRVFSVEIECQHVNTAYPTGRMFKQFIPIVPSDRVGTPYDLTNGRITHRNW